MPRRLTLLLAVLAAVLIAAMATPYLLEQRQRTHWLTTTGVRHNSECVWYARTDAGVYCLPGAGRACGKCGG